MRGDTFRVSFWDDIYSKLDSEARSRVDSHYQSLVQAVPTELKRRFLQVFPREL